MKTIFGIRETSMKVSIVSFAVYFHDTIDNILQNQVICRSTLSKKS